MWKIICAYFCIILSLCSCHGSENVSVYRMENLQQEVIPGSEDIEKVYPYDGYIYTVGDKIKRTHAVTGEQTELTGAPDGLESVSVGQYGICVINRERVFLYTEDGMERGDFPWVMPLEEYLPQNTAFSVTETKENIWIACGLMRPLSETADRFRMESQLFRMSKIDGTCARVPCDGIMIGLSQMVPGEGETVYIVTSDGVWFCDGKKVEQYITCTLEQGCYVPETDTLYAITLNSNKSLSIIAIQGETGETESIRQISKEKYAAAVQEKSGFSDGNFIIGDIWYTGTDILLWDSWNHVLSVYDDLRQNGENFYVMYPEFQRTDGSVSTLRWGSVEETMMQFEERYEIAVQGSVFPREEMEDRVRMKLLAGETDLDVVYMDDADRSSLFAALLQYDLFLPLDGYPEIESGWTEVLDGVRDAMSWNGKLYGVPVQIRADGYIVTEAYKAAGLPEIPKRWTLDNLWEICAAAESVCNGETYLMPCPTEAIVRTILETSVSEGSMDETMLRYHLDKMMFYLEKGVLGFQKKGRTFLLDTVYAPGDGMNEPEDTAGYTVCQPTYTGQNYTEITTFLFANGKSEQPELAAAYAGMLLEEDSLYVLSTCMLGRDPDRYYYLDGGNTGLSYLQTKKPVSVAHAGQYVMQSVTPVLTENSVPYLLSYGAIHDIVQNAITKPLRNGEAIDLDAVVQTICKEARYRYLE